MVDIISLEPAIQAHYELCLSQGTSPALAEMFALGQPPMSNTDREFLAGHTNGSQFEDQPAVGDLYRSQALAAGVDPKGKIYLGGLAAYPGDPVAWVNNRGDVQRVCEERGWGAKGSVNVKAAPQDSEHKSVRLADEIVDDKVADILETVPAEDRPHVDTVDLREQVKDKMGPHWKE